MKTFLTFLCLALYCNGFSDSPITTYFTADSDAVVLHIVTPDTDAIRYLCIDEKYDSTDTYPIGHYFFSSTHASFSKIKKEPTGFYYRVNSSSGTSHHFFFKILAIANNTTVEFQTGYDVDTTQTLFANIQCHSATDDANFLPIPDRVTVMVRDMMGRDVYTKTLPYPHSSNLYPADEIKTWPLENGVYIARMIPAPNQEYFDAYNFSAKEIILLR